MYRSAILPGMKHARSLLDVSIRVLEYFESHAARDAAAGTVTASQKVEPNSNASSSLARLQPRTTRRFAGQAHPRSYVRKLANLAARRRGTRSIVRSGMRAYFSIV
jgi:hypothetical protein